MGWEYEPENGDNYHEIMSRLQPESDEIDYGLVCNAFKEKHVCPRCTWFFQQGASEMILGVYDIHHGYSNPVLQSDWFIENFVYYQPKAREYDQSYGGCYRLDTNDAEEMKRRVRQLGTPIRPSDKAACEETLDAIDWIEMMFDRYTDRQVEILYFGAF